MHRGLFLSNATEINLSQLFFLQSVDMFSVLLTRGLAMGDEV